MVDEEEALLRPAGLSLIAQPETRKEAKCPNLQVRPTDFEPRGRAPRDSFSLSPSPFQSQIAVTWRCLPGHIEVLVQTPLAFFGSVVGGSRLKECTAVGMGAKVTVLRVSFADIDECSIHYSPVSEKTG